VIDRPEDYKHILAITFTNKASEEMKSRIVDSLVELSEKRNATLEKILQDELPAADIPVQAKKALELILHDYGSFSVCTIDSFFQRVMRSLAREIHLPLRYEVEMRTDEVIEAITEMLLNDVGRDAELTEWLSDLIIQKLDDEKSWSIEGDIRFMAAQLFKEKSIADQPLSREHIRNVFSRLLDLKKSFERSMKSSGEEVISVIHASGLEVDDFSRKEKGVAGYFYKISKPDNPEKFKPGQTVMNALDSAELWATKTSSRRKEIIALVESRLMNMLEKILSFYDAEHERYFGSIEVLKKMYMLGIVSDLQNKLAEYREEKNTVMISDTPKILHSFISADDAPFIFEKTGSRYKHFLIDEFQDTSDLQWKNLLPLINHSLGSGYFSMVVGDAKQSIYRWRGGNMNLLAREVRQSLKPFDSIITEENLATNYRSKKNIIEFNNAFFQSIPAIVNEALEIREHTLLHIVYSDELKQDVPPKNNAGGMVSLQFFEKDKPAESEGEQTLNWKEQSLQHVLSLIRELPAQGYSLSDIAILVRNNSEGNDIADFLFDHGITKIVSPDSLLLSRSPLIIFLIHVFRFLADPDNAIARSHILYYYTIHLSGKPPADLHSVFTDARASESRKKRKKDPTLFDVKALDDTLFNQLLPEEFTGHLLFLSKQPVYELSEQLVRIFGLNQTPDAYIQRFQDLVLEYVTKNNSSIDGFLQWWDESDTVKNCSVNIPESEEAIRILTIHKSKGLQFPVVIIPFADWKLMPDSRDLLWVNSEVEPFNELQAVPLTPSKKLNDTSFRESYREEVTQAVIDNINMMYVAFTRAEEQLYIFSPVDKGNDLNTTGKLISRVMHTNGERMGMPAMENSFILGEPTAHHTKAKKRSDGIRMEKYPSNRWQGKISITTHSADLIDMLQSPGSSKINYGILVHKILSEIRSTSEIEQVINRQLFEGLISEEEKKNLEQKITELMAVPEVSDFFSPQWTVRSEREIILPDGEILRPDRVLIKGKQAVVIDFKTGKESPSHEAQVRRYAEVLLAMDYIDVKKYIVYVGEHRVKEVVG